MSSTQRSLESSPPELNNHYTNISLTYVHCCDQLIIQREAEQALYGLEADSRYLVKVQTINEFGASRWSDDWQFDTFEGTFS